ncbi:protein translocase subunit SecF [Actinocrinis puniceicyclus]|uniref:Protein-export membrane protein SecF n=1 Tax=Actinocrinis puniceicyclus TaxID=977794 RepID=A0A8J7WPP8_9ACTN|nr:protein translocase subunit SecF [Actinocrinis puniceicyclus]MBS2965208.1 protein translocase subunit SecF [Actinocrinis puniceicyclus]
MAGLGSLGNRLYRGEVSYQIVGRRKRWVSIFGAVLLLAILGLLVRGLHFSVEFRGGSVITVPSATLTTDRATSIAAADGVPAPTVQEQRIVGGGRQITVTTTTITSDTQRKLTADLATAGGADLSKVTVEQQGAEWGHEVSNRAIQALIIFLALLAAYLAIFFEWKMAVAALASLINVIVITVGVYAWSGLEVSPSTVVGFLTILGYAMYDAVVVFDKVKENKRHLVDQGRMGYGQAANLAVNQTLVRSLNTSLIALIPVAALLFGGTISQATVLQDLALALLVGIGAGTVSSILVATPTLVWLKELEPAVRAQEQRLAAKSAADRKAGKVPAAATATATATAAVAAESAQPADEKPAATAGSAAAPVQRGPRNQPVRNQPRSKRR